MCTCKVYKVTNTMSISVSARMSTVAKVRYMCVTSIFDFFSQIIRALYQGEFFFTYWCKCIVVVFLMYSCDKFVSL